MRLPVNAGTHGFITHIDVDSIKAAAVAPGAPVEIILRVTLGAYVVFETALTGLIATLDAAGGGHTAAAVLTARKRLARSIGKLGGRSTRA